MAQARTHARTYARDAHGGVLRVVSRVCHGATLREVDRHRRRHARLSVSYANNTCSVASVASLCSVYARVRVCVCVCASPWFSVSSRRENITAFRPVRAHIRTYTRATTLSLLHLFLSIYSISTLYTFSLLSLSIASSRYPSRARTLAAQPRKRPHAISLSVRHTAGRVPFPSTLSGIYARAYTYYTA